jgi:hypothetical protein
VNQSNPEAAGTTTTPRTSSMLGCRTTVPPNVVFHVLHVPVQVGTDALGWK